MSIIEIMKNVARNETQALYTNELGVVNQVFADAYECSVTLKNRTQPDGSPLELRHVPVATQHVGLANLPRVGELVVLAFIGGDINAPLVIGRLYSDQHRPPESQPGRLVLRELSSVRIQISGTSIEIDEQGHVRIDAKDNNVVVNGGTQGAARVGDTVTVELTAVPTQGWSPTPAPTPMELSGTITSGSSTVKIGD